MDFRSSTNIVCAGQIFMCCVQCVLRKIYEEMSTTLALLSYEIQMLSRGSSNSILSSALPFVSTILGSAIGEEDGVIARMRRVTSVVLRESENVETGTDGSTVREKTERVRKMPNPMHVQRISDIVTTSGQFPRCK